MNKSMDRCSSHNGVWIPVVKNPRCNVHGMVNHRYQGFHTLFVDNLPLDVEIYEIRDFFNKFGVARDVFIPLKRSKVSGNKFGFVRYDCHVSADVAISKANGMFFKERKLFVKFASFGEKDVIEDKRLDKSRNHGFKVEADFRNRIQNYHSRVDSNKTAEIGAPFLRNNRRVGSYAEALAGHKEETKLAYKMIDSVTAHEDQISQVPLETQSSKKGTGKDPNVSTFKSSQDFDSFVEDSLGLQSLIHEIHVGEPVEMMSYHEKVLDGNPTDPSSLDEAVSRVSDFEDLDLVSNDPLIKFVEYYQSLDYSSVELQMLLNCRIRCVFWHGSFNGTMLLQIRMPSSTEYKFFLWNPSIRMSQTFSDPVDVQRVPGFYGLGYDFVTDDFKVVWAGYSRNGRLSPPVHVFSSKIGSWRKIGDFGYEIEYHVNKIETVFKGMPHWVVGRNRNGIPTTVIVCFDFTEEKFMDVPRPIYGAENDYFGLGVLGEWLCVLENWSERGAGDRLGIRAAVWVMKEYGVKKSWTKLFVVQFARGEFYINYFIVLLCSTTDGDVVMSLNRQNLVVYNPKRNSYRRIDPKVCRQFNEHFSMVSLASPHGCNDIRGPFIRSKWKRKWPFK
ncbi:hypothetical protein Vadar_010479 [Vaccinium darrowii]|uniref:Uncharacterized protein n=1 Tax=Vaccinium darrowii TaxID=229202 RepID=A0ACB7XQI2_9ERIC|nr:hypothetical protein Vadar_010479 [Vaccinium darrowii]